jgi:predicted AAA+ superfamily ATPase
LFDEIQEVDEWQLVVNSLRLDFDSDIYITGSNASILSGELSTYLAGRYVEIKVYPIFQEFLNFKGMLRLKIFKPTTMNIANSAVFLQLFCNHMKK